MVIRSLNTIRERPGEGIAGTNYVNEVVQFLQGQQAVDPQKVQTNGRHVLTPVRVKILTAATGGGKYNGKIRDVPEIILEGTSDMAEEDLGPATRDCLIFNAAEQGSSDHQITDNGINQDTYHGYIIGFTAADATGKPVVEIWGIDPGPCA